MLNAGNNSLTVVKGLLASATELKALILNNNNITDVMCDPSPSKSYGIQPKP
jgi:Leucine-rich repeat (LRR) protein